jgi:hypothetical protein
MANAEDNFFYELRPLPRTKWVSLADALSLALYGGLPTPVDAATGGALRGIDVGPIERDGRHAYFVTQDGISRELSGPTYLDVAKPGTITFGLKVAIVKEVAKANSQAPSDSHSAISSTVTEHIADYSLMPDVETEFRSRYVDLEERLCEAAASGEVKFKGIEVTGATIDDDTDSEDDLAEIPSEYFSAYRGFDENCVEGISRYVEEARFIRAHDEERKITSYFNVHVETKGFTAFLKREYPAILSEKIQFLLMSKARKEDLAKQLATHLVRASQSEERITREAALAIVGAPSVKTRWFMEVWGHAHLLAEMNPKSGRPSKP